MTILQRFRANRISQYFSVRSTNAFLSVALVVVSIGILWNVRGAHSQDHATEGSSVVLREVLTAADGTNIAGPTYVFATRADGSSVFEGIQNKRAIGETVRIVRLASGIQGMISDQEMQKYVTPMASGNPGAPQNLRLTSSSCVVSSFGESAVAREIVDGYKSQKVTMGNRTSWYALDYGCALVKEHFDWSNGAKSDKYLVMLRPGQPEGRLFDIPASYQEVPQAAF